MNAFEIKILVKQRDIKSPILLNCLPERVIAEYRKCKNIKGIGNK